MRFGATLILLLSLLLAPASGRAQEANAAQHLVKAAMLFSFAKFVEWPQEAFADAKSPLCIGVLGDNPIGSVLERTLRDKTLNNRPITVKMCRTLEEAKKCHVLYVSAKDNKALEETFAQLGTATVLTVGETDAFIKSGGVINFFREGDLSVNTDKFRFEINAEAARKAKLKIDSKLLGLGKKQST